MPHRGTRGTKRPFGQTVKSLVTSGRSSTKSSRGVAISRAANVKRRKFKKKRP